MNDTARVVQKFPFGATKFHGSIRIASKSSNGVAGLLICTYWLHLNSECEAISEFPVVLRFGVRYDSTRQACGMLRASSKFIGLVTRNVCGGRNAAITMRRSTTASTAASNVTSQQSTPPPSATSNALVPAPGYIVKDVDTGSAEAQGPRMGKFHVRRIPGHTKKLNVIARQVIIPSTARLKS
jgi:hypothetical protein